MKIKQLFSDSPVTMTLLFISILMTVVFFFVQNSFMGYLFSMHETFLQKKEYFYFFIQSITFQFSHGGILHLLSNGLFLFIFWFSLENLLGKINYIFLFFFSSICIIGALLYFNQPPTIGMSGFAMAVLGYMTMELYTQKHPQFEQAFIFLLLNILIGFMSGISLVGHVSGAVAWFIFYFLYRR